MGSAKSVIRKCEVAELWNLMLVNMTSGKGEEVHIGIANMVKCLGGMWTCGVMDMRTQAKD
jgi:hypothetical protein